MKSLGRIVAKNSLANVLRSSAGGLLALLLPPFLARALSHDRFAAWALILQLAATVNLLDFGLQIAVGRYVAKALADEDEAACHRVVTTAFAMLAAAAVLAYLSMLVVVYFLPRLSQAVPPELLHEMRSSLLVLGAFYALNLPLSTFTGVLAGMQRSEFIAYAIGGTKLLAGMAIVVVVRRWPSLVVLAWVLGGWQLLGGVLQYGAVRRLMPGLEMSARWVSRAVTLELGRYCSYLSVWLLGGFLVNGLDLIFVSHFEFGATGYYAIAASLLLVVTTLNGAIFSALLPAASVLHARGAFRALGEMVVRLTRYGVYGMVAGVLPFFLVGHAVLRLWLGPDYAAHTLTLLLVLLCASVIRFAGNPYSVAMMGTGEHRHNTVGPLVEGFVNVVASLVLGMRYSAMGVAYGTLIGSVAGMACHVFYNVPRTTAIAMSVDEYGWSGLLSPALRLLPMVVVAGLPWMQGRGWISVPCAVGVGVVCGAVSCYLVARLEGWLGRRWKVAGIVRRTAEIGGVDSC